MEMSLLTEIVTRRTVKMFKLKRGRTLGNSAIKLAEDKSKQSDLMQASNRSTTIKQSRF